MTDFNLPWLRDWWGHAFEFRAEPDGKCVAIRRDDRGERVADSWPGLKRVIEDEWAERPVDKAAWVDQLTGQRGLSHLSRAGQAPAGLTPPAGRGRGPADTLGQPARSRGMGTGMHDVSVDRATGLLITIADADLLARVAARLRGDDACALPVPDGYFTTRDGEILPRRPER